jgi:hypothetical protein
MALHGGRQRWYGDGMYILGRRPHRPAKAPARRVP